MDTTHSGFSKIAIGIDFSVSAQAALEVARNRFPAAQLKLIHVVDARAGSVPDLSTGGLAPVTPSAQVLTRLSAEDEKRLDRLARAGDEEEVILGEPAQTLVQAAKQWGADLIVVGTHPQGAVAHFFLGSVAEQVLRHSDLPVLVVPHR